MQDEHDHPEPDDDLIPAEAQTREDGLTISRRGFLAGSGAVGVALAASQWFAPISRSFGDETSGGGTAAAVRPPARRPCR